MAGSHCATCTILPTVRRILERRAIHAAWSSEPSGGSGTVLSWFMREVYGSETLGGTPTIRAYGVARCVLRGACVRCVSAITAASASISTPVFAEVLMLTSQRRTAVGCPFCFCLPVKSCG